ncbi:PfkB family carbohydrate kinase [endosymbiont of unidentified scaly snail isolate Monju]|uniref:PfkB family carbohydrate kinase n=1 Tax=endosymbiont of unidentified scaly snail isolate Monju TaxID=1248727 RepID=UPI0003891CE1|nr:PfkB family carbohydrate kinase [endosymbiont of unidentified scaly snail isolate Monju]BAN69987.1 ketohexokinase [endosymbiont of unidentified scaly snail isolate Monju]
MARILCVGIATLDIVSHVERYPAEDDEVRASAQSWRTGGNAANTAVVLAQLGHQVSWTGNLGEGPASRLAERTFDRHGVAHASACRIPGHDLPVSCITLAGSGSRTIVHYRDLPEYSAAAFVTLDPGAFDRVHFEGRAVDQLQVMIRRVREAGVPVSLEVEKPREGIEALFGQADLLLFSHHYLRHHGHADPAEFLRSLPSGVVATCTWGQHGAWARDGEGEVRYLPAHLPPEVVDTLGAGDVFNAGMLHGLAMFDDLDLALACAVRLAGEQCGRPGLELAT